MWFASRRISVVALSTRRRLLAAGSFRPSPLFPAVSFSDGYADRRTHSAGYDEEAQSADGKVDGSGLHVSNRYRAQCYASIGSGCFGGAVL